VPSDANPASIGAYRVLSRLGSGGMGEVFLAEDPRLQRHVAIKRAHTADPAAAERCLTEARAVARLHHPNICDVYEVGEDGSGLFIVMPVIEGDTLQTRLSHGPLPISDAVSIALQAADALAVAHAAGVLHRDIKPGNLIVNAHGQVRVMDFGLAKLASVSDPHGLAQTAGAVTAPGSAVGTVAYMSPEQARAERVDGRSDLFSLGLVLYESVAGRHPFHASSAAAVIASLQTQDPPPLARFRSDVPDELQRIVTKLLRRSAGERYQSADDLATDLRALSRALASGSSDSTTVRAVAAHRRRVPRAAWLFAAVILLAALGGAIVWNARAPEGRATPVAGAPIDSLAVLPLTNRVPGADQEFVADGITESLIRNLAQLPQLKVISRNTAFRFRNRNADAQAVGRDLRVGSVMTGSVSRVGDQLAIDVELSRVADNTVLFSRRYLQDSARAVKIEADIAQDVVASLRVVLSGSDRKVLVKEATSNANAYSHFLRGRYLLNGFNEPELVQAVDEFQAAIDADPNYAMAYSDLATTYLNLGLYFQAPTKTMTRARMLARQALTIDPDRQEPHIVLGMIQLVYDWDYPAAAREVMKADRVDPMALGLLGCTAHMLESAGQLKDAEHEIRLALQADPLSIGLNTELGCGAYYRRKYDEAIRGFNDALKLEPKNELAIWGLGRAYAQKGQYAEALAALQQGQPADGIASPLVLSELAYVNARRGRLDLARQSLRRLTASDYPGFVDPYLVAAAYAGQGDASEVIAWLVRAVEVKSSFLPSLTEDPKWDFLRDDPRFKTIVKRVGLA
jgi:eukaryotic-like serine/threonine-protein kinase